MKLNIMKIQDFKIGFKEIWILVTGNFLLFQKKYLPKF